MKVKCKLLLVVFFFSKNSPIFSKVAKVVEPLWPGGLFALILKDFSAFTCRNTLDSKIKYNCFNKKSHKTFFLSLGEIFFDKYSLNIYSYDFKI